MITRVVFEFSATGRLAAMAPWRVKEDPALMRIIAAPSVRPVVAFQRWLPCVPGGAPGRWEFVGVGDVPPELLMRLAAFLAGAPPKGSGRTMETAIEQGQDTLSAGPGQVARVRTETLIIKLGTIDGAPRGDR
jgi:hypothetical protein